jgi:hypothetical protein
VGRAGVIALNREGVADSRRWFLAIVESRNRRDERAARHTKAVRTRLDSLRWLRALAA